MDVNNLMELYTDYLIACPGQITATGLSNMLDNDLSHDMITRLLSSGEINSKTLWQYVKPMCEEISDPEGVLILDDSVEAKRYTDPSTLISWHYDHCVGRAVKGVNFMTALYHNHEISVPVGVEYILKDRQVVNKNGKISYTSSRTKNELFRELIKQSSRNIDFSYVLADSWFCAAQNMDFIVKVIKRHFIIGMKDNRRVALSKEDKQAGRYVSINKLELEGRTMSVYIERLDFPILITKQVFKNGDGSTGALYLASDDLNLTYQQITTIYKKRWKVEHYHKCIKSNAGFAKSPTRTIQTQMSHFTASIMAFVKYERLSVSHNKSYQALKTKLLLTATRAAWIQLNQLSTTEIAV
ncbi:MAG: transposase [Sphingobacteriales bacterium]